MTLSDSLDYIYFQPSQTDYQPIFDPQELAYLEQLSQSTKIDYFFLDRNLQDFVIDFAYTSAKLEGTAYTRMEATTLLKSGNIIGNKTLEDTYMLVNMKDAFNYVLSHATDKQAKNPQALERFIKELHSIASDKILHREAIGTVRHYPVTISGTSYLPMNDPLQLNFELQKICQIYTTIDNVFEKAVYIHHNLAYLQYFYDHNKRTARNMLAYTLIFAQKMPVLFTESSQHEYALALLDYYENGSYQAFKTYFIKAYEKVCQRFGAI